MKKKNILWLLGALLIFISATYALKVTNLRGGLSVGDDRASGTNITAVDSITHDGDYYLLFQGADTSAVYTPVTEQVDIGDVAIEKELTENAQTGTTYTLVLTDAAKRITCTNAGAITLTVPPNSSVAFPVGSQIIVEQWGAGAITFAEGSGVTINSLNDNLTSQGQYGVFSLVKDATDVWILAGPLE